MSNGKVTPNSGTTDDSFSFQVTYTSTSGIAPQNVNLYVDNNSNSMGSGSSNWSNGVVYSKSLNNFSIRGPPVLFYALADNKTLRLPESGELNLNVTQSAAGWDLQVKGITVPATYLNPNQQFQAKAQVYNNSNTSDKIYKNVNYTFTLYDPSGNIQQSFPGKIDNLNQSDTKEIVEYFNAGNSNGNYQLVFTVNPTLDSNPNNNSNSFTIIVGSTGPTSQWLINPEDREVYMIRMGIIIRLITHCIEYGHEHNR